MEKSKVVETTIKDQHRYSAEPKAPSYVATVRLKIGDVFVSVEDVPVRKVDAKEAEEKARAMFSDAINFLDTRLEPSLAELTGENRIFTIKSSYGECLAYADGEVKSWRFETLADYADVTHLQHIKRFDFAEWRHYWNKTMPLNIDILDLGYWYEIKGVEQYESADASWRSEIAEKLLKCQKGNQNAL